MFQIIIKYLCFFCLGAILGSFFSVVVYRLKHGESIIKGRSHCSNCKQKLLKIDLVPIISFLLLAGKCRFCKKKISIMYPFIECCTGLTTSLFFATYDFSIQNVFLCFFLYVCIIVFFFDLTFYEIPIIIVLPSVFVSIPYFLVSSIISKRENLMPQTLFFYLLSILLWTFFFFGLSFISKEKWMGYGDTYLALFVVSLFPWPDSTIVLFFSFWIGSILAVLLVLFGRKTMKDKLPFGSVISLTAIVGILFPNILDMIKLLLLM